MGRVSKLGGAGAGRLAALGSTLRLRSGQAPEAAVPTLADPGQYPGGLG